MRLGSSEKFFKIQPCIIAITTVALMLVSFGSCGKKAESVDLVFSKETSHTMRATDVSSLISDSGVTRYRLIASEWLIYSEASEPYWYFPSGIYVEKFDSTFHAEGSVEADTAYYYTNRSEWVLLKNVKIANLQGEKFDSEKVIWDQKNERIHSDEFIRIEQKDKIITGYGFESNQEMTRYRIFNPQGIFPIPKERTDTVPEPTTTTEPEPEPAAIPPGDAAAQETTTP
jgi:LPS export ABC transporter protein LptC